MEKHFLRVSSEFSDTPGARYYTDGDNSGEEFYDKILKSAFKSALDDGSELVIDLDGTEGYATSFLDEAFVRLVKDFGKKEVLKTIKIVSVEEPDWIQEIQNYINEAQ